jgi:hypothetical protein
LRRGFSAADAGALGAAALLILIFPYVQTQVGLAAIIVVAGLVVQRTFSEINGSRAKMLAGSTQ